MMLTRVRSDTLADSPGLHRDDGCEFSPSCLACPRAICKYDDPGWNQRRNKRVRDAVIHHARDAGMPVSEIARQLGISDRTVHRVCSQPLKVREPEDDMAAVPLLPRLAQLGRRPRAKSRRPNPPLFRCKGNVT